MRRSVVKAALLVLLLGLLLAALLGFPGLLNAYLVRPVAISVWAIWRIVISIDQAVYWSLLIVVCSLGMLWIFAVRDAAPSAPAPQPTKQRTRVGHWRSLFRQAQRTPEGDEMLRASLRNLLAAIIRQAGPPTGGNVDQALAARHVSLPPRVREYLSIGTEGQAQPVDRASVLSQVRRWMRRPPSASDAVIEEALRWMESATEISHDQ